MKQKRTYVTLLLVVALLALGIAYAAYAQIDLKVTAKVDSTVTGDMKVAIKSVADANTEDAGTVTGTPNGLTATMNVTGLKMEDDVAEATVTFENTTEGVNANVQYVDYDLPQNDDLGYLSVVVTPGTGLDNIAPGQTATATIKVTLNKTIGTTDDEAKASIEGLVFNFTADPVGKQ